MDDKRLLIGGAEFITPKGAAALLGLTVGWCQELARTKQLPSKKVFGRWYIRLDALQAMLNEDSAAEDDLSADL
jgi:hypothetical protein